MSEPQKQLIQEERLTQEELQTLINVVAQVSVPVSQATPLIGLINKMSRMVDQLRRGPE